MIKLTLPMINPGLYWVDTITITNNYDSSLAGHPWADFFCAWVYRGFNFSQGF